MSVLDARFIVILNVGGEWQPEYLNVENHAQVLMRAVNRYEQIYPGGKFKLLT